MRNDDIQWAAALSDEWQTVRSVTALGNQTRVLMAYPAGNSGRGFFRVRER